MRLLVKHMLYYIYWFWLSARRLTVLLAIGAADSSGPYDDMEKEKNRKKEERTMASFEHVHVDVDSLAATLRFLATADPGIVPRGQGVSPGYGPWVHVGGDDNYLAMTEVKGAKPPAGLRHIGVVVDDLEGVMSRLQAAGYTPTDSSALTGHPYRRRIYYADNNGLPWEFIEYLTADKALQNDYSR